MPRAIREQVVQDLHDAARVRHQPGQVRRQVDDHGVPAAGAGERGPRPLDQTGELLRLGIDRHHAYADAPGVEQVADQPVHAVGLLADDAQELAKLRPVTPQPGTRRCGRGRERDSPYGSILRISALRTLAWPAPALEPAPV